MADFFATRDSIKARIEEQIPELRRVFFAEEIGDLDSASQVSPAVHLLYAGYTPAQAERVRADITIGQTWAVVLVIKQGPGKYAGGEILDKLIQALHGFKPEGARLPLELAPQPYTPTYRPRVAYYPLAFQTLIINRKGA